MSAVPEPELRYPKSVMCRRNHPGRRPVGTGTPYSIRPTSSGQAIGVLKASAGKLLTVGSDPWGSATGTVRDEGTKRPTSGGSHGPVEPHGRHLVASRRLAGPGRDQQHQGHAARPQPSVPHGNASSF